MLKLSYFQKTDPGLVRDNNEDALGMREWAGSFLFVVADGLGGLEFGEVASREAAEKMRKIFEAPVFLTNPRNLMQKYFQEVNTRIFDLNCTLSPRCMATTLTLSFFHGKKLYVGHVGDCRIYQVRKGGIQCLTRNHSSSRNVLTRVIGIDAIVEADMGEWDHEDEDVYLQCSDGLYTVVNEKEMADAARFSPKECCENLVALARGRGGPDNISLQVIRID